MAGCLPRLDFYDSERRLVDGELGRGLAQPDRDFQAYRVRLLAANKPILRQVAKDVLAGIPVTSIARQWNEAEVRSPFPRKTRLGWRAQSVLTLLMSPPAGRAAPPAHIEDEIKVLSSRSENLDLVW